jgi:hypothetical protein
VVIAMVFALLPGGAALASFAHSLAHGLGHGGGMNGGCGGG